jgi:nucleotide-binding universal stress UspA family protein
VIKEIEKSGLYDEYPQLTLTDLYLLVLDKQHNMKEAMGMTFKTENVIDFVAEQEGRHTKTTDSGADAELTKFATGEENQIDDSLFRDILVAISDQDVANIALQQAMLMNRSHRGSILGIHVIPEKHTATEYVEAMESSFYEQLNKQQMHGKFLSVTGETNRKLREFSLLSDLMVLRLRFLPGDSVFERVSSGIIRILQQGRRPVVFVKDNARSVSRILLLYDEQEKSREAFFIATYYAARYRTSLMLINIEKSARKSQESLQFARDYLAAVNVEATIENVSEDDVIEKLPEWIQEHDISTVMMRGYESSGLIGRLFASHVDRVLETVNIPVLICQ